VRSNFIPARPYIDRSIAFSRFTGPLLHSVVKAVVVALLAGDDDQHPAPRPDGQVGQGAAVEDMDAIRPAVTRRAEERTRPTV
jgi:hypothetical protein